MSPNSRTSTLGPSTLPRAEDGPALVSRSRLFRQEECPTEVYRNAEPGEEFRVFWAQRDRKLVLVGLGVACGVQVSGADRFQEVREWYRDLIEGTVVEGPDVAGTGPLALGGFRFDAEAQESPEWRRFADGMMIVPRVCYAWTPDGCWVTENRLLSSNGAGTLFTSVHDADPVVNSGMANLWTRSVEGALESVRSGEADKVVIARRAAVDGSEEMDVPGTLERLMDSEARCSVFSFGVGPDTFLGASPEPLVTLADGKLECICHAGSAARGGTAEQDRKLGEALLSDPKEQREHYLAASSVEQALRGLCDELSWDSTPRLSKLKNVQHLSTAFHGANDEGRDILEFVEALHPTPAVAGVPTRKALILIQELEEMDRGWYSGPVGWMDHKGRGEFAIAIRSGLITRNQAYLYAGAGIVEGSDVKREYAETELKMLGLRDALNLS